MRLLYIINSLGGGGAERSLVELLPFLEANEIKPEVACFRRRDESFEDELRATSVEVHHFPDTNLIRWMYNLRLLIQGSNFDLIHTTLFESDVAGRVAAAGTGIPVLTSLVNTSYDAIRLQDPNVTRLGLWKTRIIDGWTARNMTTHFHAITHAVKNASVRDLHIAPENITVIERGRDPVRLGARTPERRLKSRARLGLSPEEEVVVCVGRQEFQKGHTYLLKAFAEVAARRSEAKLLLIGRDGHASGDIRALHRELRLQDRALFLGHRDDVPEILAAADLFAFPSLYEGQGGALVEAMALGLPIVATDIPCIREVVEHDRNALLVPVASSKGLAESIHSLLSNPARMQAFGTRGSSLFHSRFTLERSANQLMDLYRALMFKQQESSYTKSRT